MIVYYCDRPLLCSSITMNKILMPEKMITPTTLASQTVKARFRSSMPPQHRGFTLLEVLVAMVIFAALSLAAYQVVSQVQRSNALSEQREQRLSEIQRAFVIMDADFRQMAARHFRTGENHHGDRLIDTQASLLESEQQGVMFTRLGALNPQQRFPRGEITKVGYRVRSDTLERVGWRYPDTPEGQEGVVRPLLTGVNHFTLRFYDGQQWHQTWTKKEELPRGIKVILTLQDYDQIERIYPIAGESKGKRKPGESGIGQVNSDVQE